MRRQIIGIAPRRRLADLQQALFDAALEVGVDQAERDAEIGGELALRLGAVALDRLEEPEHDPGVVGFLVARRLGHRPTLPSGANITAFTA